ncbi:MAG: xylulokinase [Lachnospiraceae bacterium]|nr:xylulokinase [Lachnospiraceae bacterium]
MNYYLGLDLGTGSIKTVLFDETGNAVCSSACEYPLYQPFNGWSEQDPEDWVRAAVSTVRDCMEQSGVPADAVRGLGISGQMMGCVLLSEEGAVLRRAILWNDGRSTEACEHLKKIVPDDVFLEETLTPARPGLTAAKIQWVRENEPEIFEKTRHILLPKDYLRWRLTGVYAAEVSDASATQFLDIRNRRWSGKILQALDLREEMLGKVMESCDIAGPVLPGMAEAMGITSACLAAGGASDNASAAVGTGVVVPGSAAITIGTSGTVVAFSGEPVPDLNRAVYNFCLPVRNAWHYMGSVNACGGALKWWKSTAYPKDRDYANIDREAASSSAGANRLLFLPYLNGEQSPHFDLRCRGAFVGLSSVHTRADMTRAVMEGATYALRDILEAIQKCGAGIKEIRLCGGGSRSPFWTQLVSDICHLPVYVPDMDSENSAALGAAILSMVGTGAYGSVPEACEAIIKLKPEVWVPDPEKEAVYDRVYEEFDRLYPVLIGSSYRILGLEI